MKKKLLIRHARQVVVVCQNGERVLKGSAMKNVVVLQGSEEEGFSVVVDGNGKIECIESDKEIERKFQSDSFATEIDASDMSVLPGILKHFY